MWVTTEAYKKAIYIQGVGASKSTSTCVSII
jgi:hypothetical protein